MSTPIKIKPSKKNVLFGIEREVREDLEFYQGAGPGGLGRWIQRQGIPSPTSLESGASITVMTTQKKAHAPAEHVCEVVDPSLFLLYFWRHETGGAAIRRGAGKPVSLSMEYGPAMTRKGRLGLAKLCRV